VEEHNIVIIYEDSIPLKVLSLINGLGAKGAKRFNIYVVTPKRRPFYLEDLRSIIQGVIAYTLRIMYAGSGPGDLERLVERLPSSNTTYIMAASTDGYREALRKIGAEQAVVEV
jgi:hypothetical protein